jgi:hypothetical protein
MSTVSEPIGPWTALQAKLEGPKPPSAMWDAWRARMDASNLTPEQRKQATTVLIRLMKIRAARAKPEHGALFP